MGTTRKTKRTPAKTRRRTRAQTVSPAQRAAWDRAHQERLKLIAAPFPAISPGVERPRSYPWAGTLVNRPEVPSSIDIVLGTKGGPIGQYNGYYANDYRLANQWDDLFAMAEGD